MQNDREDWEPVSGQYEWPVSQHADGAPDTGALSELRLESHDEDWSDHFERFVLAGMRRSDSQRMMRGVIVCTTIGLLLANVFLVVRLQSADTASMVATSTPAYVDPTAVPGVHVNYQRVTPDPVGFRSQPQPWYPDGPYVLGYIQLTNTSTDRHWFGYATLIGRDDLTCADSPYQDSSWLLDLPPRVSVVVTCAIPIHTDLRDVPTNEFSTYLPDELGTPYTVELHVQNTQAFMWEPASHSVPAQPSVL